MKERMGTFAYGSILVLAFVATMGTWGWVGHSYYEAKTFNKWTQNKHKVTTLDAMFMDLHVNLDNEEAAPVTSAVAPINSEYWAKVHVACEGRGCADCDETGLNPDN